MWVNVTEVDVKRKRIALSMKGETQQVRSHKPAIAEKKETYDPNDMNKCAGSPQK